MSSGSTAKATSKQGDNTPPAEVSGVNFVGNYGNLQFTMNWENPSDAYFAEVELSYSYGGQESVVVSIPKTGNSYTIDGANENNYVLVFKTKDENGNYSTGVTKKLRFGNFSPDSQEEINNGFNNEIVAILAGKLKIGGTDATDLSIFSNLELVEGKFDIFSNGNLTNLDAFSNLEVISSGILIENNIALSDFCGWYNLINGGGAPDSYTVTGNASNPNIQDIFDNCNLGLK